MSAKKNCLVFFAIAIFIFLSTILGVGYYLFSHKQPPIEQGMVVEIVLKGMLPDFPPKNTLDKIFKENHLSMWNLKLALEQAAQDNRISGIYLEIHPLSLSWAQIEELRSYIRIFRKSNKPVHVLLAVDMIQEKELYLASTANSITANIDAGTLINGLLAELTFFKHTMDKLGVKPQFIQFKEYKSAQNFTRDQMSLPIRKMYTSIITDLEERFISTVALDRQIQEKTIKRIMQAGLSSAQKALDQNLIDTLGYRTDVEKRFTDNSKTLKEYQGIDIVNYLAATKDHYNPNGEKRVAILEVSGMITSGHSNNYQKIAGGATIASNLKKIREDKEINGVILRVNSPGGSAVGSDMVWKEVQLLEESGKPVIVSMSGVAGSGGYYISMAAKHIISQPSTITGSIGVIFGTFNIKELYQKLGITVDQIKLSPNADILSPFHSLTLQQRKDITSWMEFIYQTFVKKAAQGRNQNKDKLELKARGRIYTGSQAQKIGLVDELGGLQEAIDRMKKTLNVDPKVEIELFLYPEPKTIWESLASGNFLQETTPSLTEWLSKEIQFLTTPTPWLLMPEPKIY